MRTASGTEVRSSPAPIQWPISLYPRRRARKIPLERRNIAIEMSTPSRSISTVLPWAASVVSEIVVGSAFSHFDETLSVIFRQPLPAERTDQVFP